MGEAYLLRMQWFLGKLEGVAQPRTILMQIIYLVSLLLLAVSCFGQSVNKDEYVRAIALSADGKLLAEVNLDGSITVNQISAKQKFQLDGLKPVRAFALAFSSDGQILAAGENNGTIKIWSLSEAKIVRTIVQSSGVWSVAFNQQGTQLAAGGNGFVQVWDARKGNEIRRWAIKGTCLALAFDPGGNWLAAAEGSILHAWSLKDSGSFEGKADTFMIDSVAFSPRGNLIATGGMMPHNGTVQIWRIDQALSNRTLATLPSSVQALIFSPDETRLAAGCSDGTIRLWRSSDGREIQEIKSNEFIGALVFSRDDLKLIAATRPNLEDRSNLLVWDSQTGQELSSLP